MVIFQFAMLVYQRVTGFNWWLVGSVFVSCSWWKSRKWFSLTVSYHLDEVKSAMPRNSPVDQGGPYFRCDSMFDWHNAHLMEVLCWQCRMSSLFAFRTCAKPQLNSNDTYIFLWFHDNEIDCASCFSHTVLFLILGLLKWLLQSPRSVQLHLGAYQCQRRRVDHPSEVQVLG